MILGFWKVQVGEATFPAGEVLQDSLPFEVIERWFLGSLERKALKRDRSRGFP